MKKNLVDSGIPSWLLKQFDRISNEVVFLADYTSGTVLYVSPAVHLIMGYDSSYFLEKGFGGLYAIIYGEDLVHTQEKTATYLMSLAHPDFDKRSIPSITFEFRIKHGEGHVIWLHDDIYTIKFKSNGKPQLLLSIMRDISSQKAAEQMLWNKVFELEPDPEKQKVIVENYKALANQANGLPIPANLIEMSFRTHPQNNLTEREKDILKLIANGKSSKEISELLQISFHTTETHRKNILKKFDVKNVAELIKEAGRSYWLGS